MSDDEKPATTPKGLGPKDTETLLKYYVSPQDIENYEALYLKQVNSGEEDVDTKFRYAWCLVHSRNSVEIKKGITFMEDLFQNGNTQTKRDCLFYLAVAQAKLKDYCTAKKYVSAFLSVEPNNVQAQQLQSYVESALRKDGVAGMAIIGGAAILGGAAAIVVGGVVLATGACMALFKSRKKN